MRRRTVKKKRSKSKSKRIMSQKYKKLPNVKFFMISYKGNSEFAKLTQRILKKEWGYSCKIYWGYQIDGDKYKRNNVLFEGVKDKMLPFMKKHNGPAYYIEDDIRFTEDPLKIPKKDVVWSVYRKGSIFNKPPHNVITGSQAIYFSKKAVQALYKHMHERKRGIHIDSYFSEFIRKHPKLSFKQMKSSLLPPLKTGIGYEELHPSLIDPNRSWKIPQQ
tara:strand:- start:657 stop:1310 length:654 start_codon:yes stop_codon:yes gene_type:complete